MKHLKKCLCILFVAAMSLSFTSLLSAEKRSAYGPQSKQFGAGLYLGEPTGFTLKGYPTERLAFDGILAWSFVDKSFTIIGDATYDVYEIPVKSSVITLPLYAGGGLKIAIHGGTDRPIVGLRIPVGVSVQFIRHPIEIFAEIAPGVGIAPATEFDLTGGIGTRFYF